MEDKSMKTPENNIRSILKCTNYEPKRRKVAFASDDDEANSDASSDVMEVEVSLTNLRVQHFPENYLLVIGEYCPSVWMHVYNFYFSS